MTKDGQKVYQHGTLALLVPGLFDGTMKLAELLAHGDTGIGTATGLNGEMIVLDGTPYLVHRLQRLRLRPFLSQRPCWPVAPWLQNFLHT